MKYAYKKVNICAPFPTKQLGYLGQNELIKEFKDELNARIISFKNENDFLIHISLDLLCFDLDSRDELENRIRKYFNNQNIHLITSATHTHYAHSIRDKKYLNYLLDLLEKEIINLSYVDKENITTSFIRSHNLIAGKSRLTNYETDLEFTCILSFYANDERFLSIIINNSHPTTISSESKFFSSEYPGLTLKMLEKQYDEDFSFMLGAAGDISSRFIRKSQDYSEMEKVTNKLVDEINVLLAKNINKKPLKLGYKEVNFKYEYDNKELKFNEPITNLTKREIDNINIGKSLREELIKGESDIFGKLLDEIKISSLDLGSIKLIFYPNEIFSAYLNYLDLDKKYLVSYSNGYGPYVTPIDFKYITYEAFIDTLSKKTKENLIEIFKTI